jgi:putative endonuclease
VCPRPRWLSGRFLVAPQHKSCLYKTAFIVYSIHLTMDFFVYIIYSEKLDAFYIGQTMDIDQRIREHNQVFFKNSSTSKSDDWKLFFSLKCTSRKQAILIERHIKRMRSRKYYSDLLKFTEISNKLLLKYKND